MKSISESKLKAFSIGRMNVTKNVLSKRDKDDLKKKEEEQKTAEVYKDFVATFEGSKSNIKTFVRGEVVNPDSKTPTGKGKLYKPKSRFDDDIKPTSSPITPKINKPDKPSLKKKEIKKKSNLELFKEELKVMQLEREQRHSVKKGGRPRYSPEPLVVMTARGKPSRFEPPDPKTISSIANNLDMLDDIMATSRECSDPMSTNLFLGNVNPKLDEQQLCELFGKYGPLASVKVMWPRTEDERARERNCAFVAFMTRKDADRALRHLQGRDIKGYEMKMGWGKVVPVPPHPVYVPPALLERTMPPPPSGLPFNCQPNDPSKRPAGMGLPPEFRDHLDFEDTVRNSVVRVVVPTERNLLCLIHRMIEFVVREGPMFEAMIMNREINNPMFRFLFDNKSPAHIYYRWRLFTILQGESPTKYRQGEFRMFKNGSMWKPPPLNPYSGGMVETDSDEDLPMAKREEEDKQPVDDRAKGELQEEDRDALEDILRSLMPRQKAVGEAMVFCLEHADCAEEIVECVAESLSILETPLSKKIARFYLVSDVLHNCSAKVANASFFRKHFEAKLNQVMKDLRACHENISSRLRAEQFKQKVLTCFRAWDDWTIYPDKLLIHLQNVFLGLVKEADPQDEEESAPEPALAEEEDVNGRPLEELESADGVPLPESFDLDGMPLDGEPIDGVPMETKAPKPAPNKFVQSKWETVDPEEVEAQAMTTSKWEQLESEPLLQEEGGARVGENAGGKSEKTSEIKREKLREIEVKVMKYQDGLESGQHERKPGLSVAEQLEQYRNKLVEKEQAREEKERKAKEEKKRDHRRSTSSSSEDEKSRRKKRKRAKDSHTPKRGGGLVSYESDESSDSSRRRNSSKKKQRRHSRSRSRSRHSRRSPVRRRSYDRSRSRSRDRKKKRKSRH